MSFGRHRLQRLAILLSIVLPFAASRAQTFTGTVVGRAFDSQQAVVPGAAVILGSLDRDFERHATTNAQGEYSFQLVPPGKFTVQAQASESRTEFVQVPVVAAGTIDDCAGLRLHSQQTEKTSLGRILKCKTN